jgi:hypothetical protein
MPELPWHYLELFVRAAENSGKPHYLLHTRPGVMNREQEGSAPTKRSSSSPIYLLPSHRASFAIAG